MSRAFNLVLGIVGELLITIGVLLLLFVGWQLWWTDAVANRGQSAVTKELLDEWQAAPEPPAVPGELSRGDAFAILHIPRFGADWARPVVSGTSAGVLERGVGHYPDTAMPGQIGNLGLAGHRVTYGRPFFQIDQLRAGDPIVVEAVDGWYTYRMTSSEIVRPSDVRVIAPVPNQPDAVPTERYVTLTACHPKYSARQRFIVHGVLDSFQPRSSGPPASLAGES